MARLSTIGLIAVTAIVMCVGCSVRAPKLYKPDTPAVLSDTYTVAQYQKDKVDQQAAMDSGKFDVAQVLRNRMIWNQKFACDNVYEDYAAGLGAVRATAGAASDIAQSTIAGAGVILGTQRAKELLAAAGLWSQSVERSIRSRYHGDVSPEVFIGYMDRNRTVIAKELDACLAQDVKGCPYEKARDILGRYFWSGTFQRARQAIAESAAATPK